MGTYGITWDNLDRQFNRSRQTRLNTAGTRRLERGLELIRLNFSFACGIETGKPRRAQNRGKSASRPVSRVLWGGLLRARVTAIHLGRPLPDASRNQPERLAWKPAGTGRGSTSLLFGLAPGGVYRAGSVAGPAVGSYPTLSPLPPGEPDGGLLSVALSLGSPPPGVTRHRVSMEPGLSSPAAFRHLSERPSGRLAILIRG